LQEGRFAGEKLEEGVALEPEGEARSLGASVPSAHPGERLEDASVSPGPARSALAVQHARAERTHS
jgi:hypothetical protein